MSPIPINNKPSVNESANKAKFLLAILTLSFLFSIQSFPMEKSLCFSSPITLNEPQQSTHCLSPINKQEETTPLFSYGEVWLSDGFDEERIGPTISCIVLALLLTESFHFLVLLILILQSAIYPCMMSSITVTLKPPDQVLVFAHGFEPRFSRLLDAVSEPEAVLKAALGSDH